MSNLSSDAIVFFGASGDLAYKQIFPSLLRLVRDEGMRVPIIGVAKSGWSLQNLKDRAKDSLENHGGVDPDSLQLLTNLLRYVVLPSPNADWPGHCHWIGPARQVAWRTDGWTRHRTNA
jgi:glucose-6-phosphate 1-dehydrogenase